MVHHAKDERRHKLQEKKIRQLKKKTNLVVNQSVFLTTDKDGDFALD